MRVVVHSRFGNPDVLKIVEKDKPVPLRNEVLVKVAASNVTLFDCWMRSNTSPPGFGFLMKFANGFKIPRHPTPGTDFSGVIEGIGESVQDFKPGDHVFGFTGLKLGTHAEYLTISADDLVLHKPVNLSFESSAGVVQGALTAHCFLSHSNINPDSRVLVYGASGGVGQFAVQIAKLAGAHVSGVCSSLKSGYVESLGADQVFSYETGELEKTDQSFDIIFDTMGKCSLSWSEKSLRKGGVYICTTFNLMRLLRLFRLKTRYKKGIGSLSGIEPAKPDLQYVKDLFEKENLKAMSGSKFPNG